MLKFLKAADMKDFLGPSADIDCRHSRIKAFLPLFIFASVMIGIFVAMHRSRGGLSILFCVMFGGFGLIFIAVVANKFLKTFTADNWILKVSGAKLFIKFRSLLNRKLPADDIQIIELDADDILSVNKTRITRTSIAMKGKKTEFLTVIHIHLRTADDGQLAEILAGERKKRIRTKHTSGIIQDYPVTLPEPNLLRINWGGITPSASSTLEQLKGIVTVTEPEKIYEDLTLSSKDKREIDDKIIALLESGNKIGAIRMLRKASGMSLKQARDFVDQIEQE